MMLVVASIAATLDGLELGKFLFPVTQDVRLNATQVTDFADGEVALSGDGRQIGLRTAGHYHEVWSPPPSLAFGWNEK